MMNIAKLLDLLMIHAGLFALVYRAGYYYAELARSTYYSGLFYFIAPHNGFPYPYIAAVFLGLGILGEIYRFTHHA